MPPHFGGNRLPAAGRAACATLAQDRSARRKTRPRGRVRTSPQTSHRRNETARKCVARLYFTAPWHAAGKGESPLDSHRVFTRSCPRGDLGFSTLRRAR
eukprot:4403147-Alexandrium_andersonii.AAC.1